MALKQVGPYQILSELGRGAFGAVFLARREGLERQVALKVLLPGADEISQARFKQEAKLASQLEHPNVVRCCDLGRDVERGLLYLALDYVEGGSLKERLKLTGALPPEEAARLVAQLSEALDYAHRAGVLHRDLKPDNVLLKADGQALLTDFGLAKDMSVSGLTSEGLVVGTPNYFAPETLDGGPATEKSDVYGAGLLLYECLTAKRTFPGNDFYVVTSAIRRGNYQPLKSVAPQVPRELARICQRACALEANARYASAGDLRHALQTFLAAPAADTDGGIPAYSGSRGSVPIWQLGLLFLALFLLAGAATAVVLVAVDDSSRAAPIVSPVDSPQGAPATPTPSALAVVSASPTPLEPGPRPVAEASQEELEARANRGDSAAAEALAERALALWDHDRALEWAALAGSARVRLADRTGRAEQEERGLAASLQQELRRTLAARPLLPRVQGLLKAHSRAPRLRTCEADLLLWLGRPAAALRALDQGARGKRIAMLRGLAQESVRIGIQDTPADDPLHEAWDCFRGGSWSVSGDEGVTGKGLGLGPFGLSGLLERRGPRSGTFEGSVEIKFDSKIPGRYGGLFVLQDADTGLLIYLYHGEAAIPPEHRAAARAMGEQGALMLRVAYLLGGQWRPFTADQVFPFKGDGWHSLQGKIVLGKELLVRVDGRAATPIKLPREVGGRLGILKWYEHELTYRKFRSGP